MTFFKQIIKTAKKEPEMLQQIADDVGEIEFELELQETKREKTEHEMENITSAIIDLRDRFKNFTNHKTEREQRINELEKRIKEKVMINYTEIKKIEKQLEIMQERYDQVKETGKYDQTILQEIESKISKLKNRLLMKKAGIDTKIKIPQKRILTPIIKEKQTQRHNMILTAERSLPLPEPQQPIRIKENPLEGLQAYKPKKGFFKRLLHL